MPTELGTYQTLAERIRTGDRAALRARWEFGRRLLAEREANGGNQLPAGRLDDLSRTYDLDRRELQRWMQFAEEFDTRTSMTRRVALTALGTRSRTGCAAREGPPSGGVPTKLRPSRSAEASFVG